MLRRIQLFFSKNEVAASYVEARCAANCVEDRASSHPQNAQRDASSALWRLGVVLAVTGGLGLGACKPQEQEAAKVKVDQAKVEQLSKAAELEKVDLTLGFIKLTDCAPLVIAKELGFFEAEGLNVKVEAQANWKVVLDRTIAGELDGSMMLAGQPIGAAVGAGGLSAQLVVPFIFDRHGNGITVSNAVWEQMQKADAKLKEATPSHPISAAAMKGAVDEGKRKGKPLNFGMTFPTSTHNLELRYWLAAGGVNPGMYGAKSATGQEGAEVLLSVTPPPQMPATLEAGTLNGYCVGEPWNQQSVMKGIGVAVATSDEIIPERIEKVLGLTAAFVKQNPKTTRAIVKAMIRAAEWLDGGMENRNRAVEILSRKEYVGADQTVLKNSMTGTFLYQKSDRQERPRFNEFFANYASYPYYSDAVWFLTQMRRWGMIAESKPESFYFETAKSVFVPAVYREAAEALISEGKLKTEQLPPAGDGFREPSPKDISGISFDGKKPLDYLKAQSIGNRD